MPQAGQLSGTFSEVGLLLVSSFLFLDCGSTSSFWQPVVCTAIPNKIAPSTDDGNFMAVGGYLRLFEVLLIDLH